VTSTATAPPLVDRWRPLRTDEPWRLNRRKVVLALSGVTALTEVADIAGLVPPIELAGLSLSMSTLPAMALACACGSRLLGRSSIRRAAIGFWVLSAVLLSAMAVAYLRRGDLDLYVALIIAALDEELVYRLAIPAVIAASLRLGKVRPNPARIAGLAGAGLMFVLLPGHLEQMDSLAGALPYVAFATLSALIVYRSGSILPMAIGHAIANLLTVLMWQDAVPSDTRSMLVASMLGLLVLAYGRPARITYADDGGLLDTRTGQAVVAIDLRDGQQPLLELEDGRFLPVHKAMVLGLRKRARWSPRTLMRSTATGDRALRS
jgi:membrane protease YdiL (CAAX protease family)